MMSPEEVRTVTFDKQNMGGYRRVDVDSFLQQIADELEESQRKQAEAEKKLLVLAQKIEEYRKDEDNVKTALLNAQRMAENIIREARQKSEAMLREAGIKADDIVQNAKGRVTDEQLELERVPVSYTHLGQAGRSARQRHQAGQTDPESAGSLRPGCPQGNAAGF